MDIGTEVIITVAASTWIIGGHFIVKEYVRHIEFLRSIRK